MFLREGTSRQPLFQAEKYRLQEECILSLEAQSRALRFVEPVIAIERRLDFHRFQFSIDRAVCLGAS